MNQSESGVVVRMRMYHPLIEVYIQNLALDEQLGWVPTEDEYFLGQFHLGDAPQLRQLSQAKKARSFASRLPAAPAPSTCLTVLRRWRPPTGI